MVRRKEEKRARAHVFFSFYFCSLLFAFCCKGSSESGTTDGQMESGLPEVVKKKKVPVSPSKKSKKRSKKSKKESSSRNRRKHRNSDADEDANAKRRRGSGIAKAIVGFLSRNIKVIIIVAVTLLAVRKFISSRNKSLKGALERSLVTTTRRGRKLWVALR